MLANKVNWSPKSTLINSPDPPKSVKRPRVTKERLFSSAPASRVFRTRLECVSSYKAKRGEPMKEEMGSDECVPNACQALCEDAGVIVGRL